MKTFEEFWKWQVCVPTDMEDEARCIWNAASRPTEIRQLKHNYPELMERALIIERSAKLTSLKGLGINVKWADIISNNDMFEENYQYVPEMICECYEP